MIRLDKFIGNNSQLSRSQIHTAIKQGLITVNGEAITKTNAKILESDFVCINDQLVEIRVPRYIALYKPEGYVCANSDGEHPTVIDLLELPFKHELQIAGRLDLDTTGLVLLTDDGDWNHKVTSPSHSHTKTYRITTADPIDMKCIDLFDEGILLRNETKKTLPAKLSILDSHSARLDICEGKYHQVKRMFAAVGNRVITLHRERIGCVSLDNLLPRQYRDLTNEEIASFGK